VFISTVYAQTTPAAAGIAAPGVWQTQYVTLPPLPIKLSLHTPGGRQAVDVDNVSLATAERVELVRNGSFARGMNHWFFATDVDPPWHIHSLPGAAAAGGLAAFLVSGSLNTLIDEPRFLWLFLVLAWLCAYHGRLAHGAPMATRAAEQPRGGAAS